MAISDPATSAYPSRSSTQSPAGLSVQAAQRFKISSFQFPFIAD
jgi:hypothetical protein